VEFNEYTRKYVHEIDRSYDILRTAPQIVKLARDALNKNLDSKLFPFAGDEKQQDSQRNKGP
jgi:protein-disulfide isomerase